MMFLSFIVDEKELREIQLRHAIAIECEAISGNQWWCGILEAICGVVKNGKFPKEFSSFTLIRRIDNTLMSETGKIFCWICQPATLKFHFSSSPSLLLSFSHVSNERSWFTFDIACVYRSSLRENWLLMNFCLRGLTNFHFASRCCRTLLMKWFIVMMP